MRAWIDQLDLLIRSRTPILWIRQQEEERLKRLLAQAAQRLGQRLLLQWDFVAGLQGLANHQGQAARNPMAALDSFRLVAEPQAAILLLLDFHRFVDDSAICRRLCNLATELRQRPFTLVISAPDLALPREWEANVTVVELPLPEAGEIRLLLEGIASASQSPLEASALELLVRSCRGLPEQRIRQLAARALARHGGLEAADLDDVLEEKRLALARSDLLEYCPPPPTPAKSVGLTS
jgi:hypothetical protein